MTLHDPKSTRFDSEYVDKAMACSKTIADDTSDGSEVFVNGAAISLDNPSPMLIHWAYQAATILSRDTSGNNQSFERLEKLKKKLKVLGRRWVAGGRPIFQALKHDVDS